MKLSNGSDINVDLKKVNITEMRKILSSEIDFEESDELTARVIGITADELRALNYEDFLLVGAVFWKAVDNLRRDVKNLVSASISD